MAILCADISCLPGLDSIRLRAGWQGSQNVVRWPYVAEGDSLAPWVRGGELVFVTGISQPRSEASLQQLVREGIEQRVAGIAMLTGADGIREIPGSVIKLANELGCPLFEQPYALPLVVVTETLSNAIVQDNLIGQSTKLFLTRLFHGVADTPELIQLRAKELGLEAEGSYVLVAIRLAERREAQDASGGGRVQPQDLHVLEQQLVELLKRRGIEWPVLQHEHSLIIIWPTPPEQIATLPETLEQAMSTLKAWQPSWPLYAGVSERQSGLRHFAKAADQATQALQFAQQQQNSPLFFYERLGIARLFAAISQRSMLAGFCEEQLGPLCFAHDRQSLVLKHTVRAFLEFLGNQQQASAALGIHRNTLRQRLKRTEQLTGHSLQDPYVRLNLQNALLIEQILFHHHSIDAYGKS
ncbi:PucR family transcriptional regulator [Salinicola salarius]|uniref:PucR family transcriptional regulator n=1 Tax=Salinicola salarius TaxID=430457 RepID=UPI000B3FF821|nr:PucR family transcriptional regulator [Salinicola salarius]